MPGVWFALGSPRRSTRTPIGPPNSALGYKLGFTEDAKKRFTKPQSSLFWRVVVHLFAAFDLCYHVLKTTNMREKNSASIYQSQAVRDS